jgi:hypothetical protein
MICYENNIREEEYFIQRFLFLRGYSIFAASPFEKYFQNKLPADLKFTSQKGVVKGGLAWGKGLKKGNPGSWRSS